MNFPFYIAKRYLFTKSSNNAINIITIIAGIGVIIGSAALFIVLSGFAGLKDFSLQFSTLVDPDLKITALKGKKFTLKEDLKKEIYSIEGVASFTQVIEERVVLNSENKNLIVSLKGVDSNFPKPIVDSILVQGNWMEPGANQLVSGWGVSNNLAFSTFDFGKTIKIYVPKPGKGQVTSIEGVFNYINVVNSGIFQINETLDNSLAYTNIDLARRLLNYNNNEVTDLEVVLRSEEDLAYVKQRLESLLGSEFIIKNKLQLNEALYKMLNTENLIVYLIFTLVLIIALFNVIGSIIMMILDKRKNLNTLFNLGVTINNIRRIFFLQGSLMAIFGGVLGLILGVLLVILQKQFSLVMLTPSLAYPVTFKFINILIVLFTISILGVLASKIASVRISDKLIRSNL